MPSIKPESHQSDPQNEYRQDNVIGLGYPRREADAAQYDRKDRCRTAYSRQNRRDPASCHQRAVIHKVSL